MNNLPIHLAICLTMTILGCSSTLQQFKPATTNSDPRISSITNNRDTYGSTRLEYKSYSELRSELNKKAETQLWAQQEITNQKAILPVGGELIVYIQRITIGAANTKWFTVIVKDEGTEIVREKGEESVPDYFVLLDETIWWNLMIVDLPSHSEHFTVYVVDALLNKRHEFSIDEVSLQ